MKFKDYYQTLGVARGAPADEVKRSYRRLARKFHPDVSKEPDAETRFKEVREAYEVLKDPDKRAAYDRFGEHWKTGQDFRPPPDWNQGFDFAGGGGVGAGEFSDFFESLFGRARAPRGGRGASAMKGEDLRAQVVIPLEDAYRGTTRTVTLQRPERDHSGRAVNRRRSLNVKIPRGVTEGQRIRLGGQGGPGFGGTRDGDLYLEVRFEPHRLFRADGRDVHLKLPVAPWEVALGRSVTVPTLGGRVELRIPAGSQSGSSLRLKGRGLPGSPAGDQYVVLEMVTPKADTDAARALYERMERELAFDPRAGLDPV